MGGGRSRGCSQPRISIALIPASPLSLSLHPHPYISSASIAPPTCQGPCPYTPSPTPPLLYPPPYTPTPIPHPYTPTPIPPPLHRQPYTPTPTPPLLYPPPYTPTPTPPPLYPHPYTLPFNPTPTPPLTHSSAPLPTSPPPHPQSTPPDRWGCTWSALSPLPPPLGGSEGGPRSHVPISALLRSSPSSVLWLSPAGRTDGYGGCGGGGGVKAASPAVALCSPWHTAVPPPPGPGSPLSPIPSPA